MNVTIAVKSHVTVHPGLPDPGVGQHTIVTIANGFVYAKDNADDIIREWKFSDYTFTGV